MILMIIYLFNLLLMNKMGYIFIALFVFKLNLSTAIMQIRMSGTTAIYMPLRNKIWLSSQWIRILWPSNRFSYTEFVVWFDVTNCSSVTGLSANNVRLILIIIFIGVPCIVYPGVPYEATPTSCTNGYKNRASRCRRGH